MSNDDILNTKDNNTVQGTSEDGSSKEKSREERINIIINELNILISDIRNSRQFTDVIVQSQALNLTQGTPPSQAIPTGETPAQYPVTPTGQPPVQYPVTPTTQPPTQCPMPPTTQPPTQCPVPPTTQPPTQCPVPPTTQPPTQCPMPPTTQPPTQSQAAVNAALAQAAQTLTTIDTIKTELCRLPLDFCEREYISNCVTPLETAMEFVSRTGFELATSVSILTTSPIVPRKKGKLKDTIHTIYRMNEEVEDLFEVLKPRLRRLTQEDNCCIFL